MVNLGSNRAASHDAVCLSLWALPPQSLEAACGGQKDTAGVTPRVQADWADTRAARRAGWPGQPADRLQVTRLSGRPARLCELRRESCPLVDIVQPSPAPAVAVAEVRDLTAGPMAAVVYTALLRHLSLAVHSPLMAAGDRFSLRSCRLGVLL